MNTATALSHPNIAFIKYWGNRDHALHLPANGSLSMNLDGLTTRTTVTFQPSAAADTLVINGRPADRTALDRVSRILDIIRQMAGTGERAAVVSENNFPAGTGVASSASAFAALALAGSAAAGLELGEPELSRLARRGSGSASRSVPGGFVEWPPGSGDRDSFARSIAPAGHWHLVDCVAIVSTSPKDTSSLDGHALAPSSPLQEARVADTPRRLDICRRAILARDFDALAAIVEIDSDMMHAVMLSSTPALHYWTPTSEAVMSAVRRWRRMGTPVCYTVDAGPNVHVLTLGDEAQAVEKRLRQIPGVIDVRAARAGGAATLVQNGD
jgi:diphosphomevalonate decarboxylase